MWNQFAFSSFWYQSLVPIDISVVSIQEDVIYDFYYVFYVSRIYLQVFNPFLSFMYGIKIIHYFFLFLFAVGAWASYHHLYQKWNIYNNSPKSKNFCIVKINFKIF